MVDAHRIGALAVTAAAMVMAGCGSGTPEAGGPEGGPPLSDGSPLSLDGATWVPPAQDGASSVDAFGAGFNPPPVDAGVVPFGVVVRQADAPVVASTDFGLQLRIQLEDGVATRFTAASPPAPAPLPSAGAYLVAVSGCGYGGDVGVIKIQTGQVGAAQELQVFMTQGGQVTGNLSHPQLPGGQCTIDYGSGEITLMSPGVYLNQSVDGGALYPPSIGRLLFHCSVDAGRGAYIEALFTIPVLYEFLLCAKTSRSSRP